MKYLFIAFTKSQRFEQTATTDDPETHAKNFANVILQFRDGPVLNITWAPC